MGDRVLIFDTTLRDGEQTPGVNLNLTEKLEIARQLERLGADVIEAGFAGASLGDFEAVEAISREVRTPVICSLARCLASDIERAAQALSGAAHPRLHVFLASSALHLEKKLHMTQTEALDKAAAGVRLARSLCEDVQFSAEDASRSDPAFLARLYEAVIAEGASTINITDTVGYATANEFSRLVQDLFKLVNGIGRVRVSVHCHNDLGLAVANSLVAVRHGARQVECTMNGLGERAGNAALEEIVMGLNTRRDYYGAECGINTKRLYVSSRLISTLTGQEIPPNKPVIGANAFMHQSGIHQHGVAQDRATYEIMRAEDVGVPAGNAPLGKLSGRHALRDQAARLGFTLTDADLNTAFKRFKELADRKKDVTERDLIALLSGQWVDAPELYHLESYQLFAGNTLTPTATVKIKHGGSTVTEAAVGDGPIDAAYRAVDRITAREARLESYSIRAVTEGQDALGEVTVRVTVADEDGKPPRRALGKGAATDIIEASILAYVNAVNRALIS
ncbi:MAG: 2-isopropylmalate synthase [Oscillospiraceae bacterium]|jgi:2-isopropylmalate synthase|nr:2-isopropylmalate synthase [Oscillospiraceae bacterium]